MKFLSTTHIFPIPLLLLAVCTIAAFSITLYCWQKKKILAYKLELARNLHDEIGPLLYSAGIMFRKSKCMHGQEYKMALEELDQSIELVRNLSHDLKKMHDITTKELAGNLKNLLDKAGKAVQINVILKYSGYNRKLSFMQFTNLKLIVSELITNSLKYSQCDRIEIHMSGLEKYLEIIYYDNGIGMGNHTTGSADGIGIENIQERSVAASATISFTPPPGRPPGFWAIISAKYTK